MRARPPALSRGIKGRKGDMTGTRLGQVPWGGGQWPLTRGGRTACTLGAPREEALELGGGKHGPPRPGQRLGSHWLAQVGVTCRHGSPGATRRSGLPPACPLACPLRATTGGRLSGPQLHCTSS